MWSEIASAVDFSASAMLVLIATYAILSPRVHDGVVIKLGLIFVALGAAGLSASLWDGLDSGDIKAMTHSTLMLNVGLLIVIVGMVLRLRTPISHERRRRVSDLVPLDESPTSTFKQG